MIRMFLAALSVCAWAMFAGMASAHDAKDKPAGLGKRTIVRKINGKWRPFHFHDRQRMKKGHPQRRFQLAPLKGLKAVALPIDWAKLLQFPMYGNDRLGDCMWAAAGHGQGTFTGNVGTEIIFVETALEDQYMQLSGGDNGLDEGTLIQGWTAGMNGAPAGSAKQCIVDALDIDPTNAAMCQTAIQYFGGILFMLDVPDAWINNFSGNGSDVWDAPAAPDQNNGHGVWWNGVDTNGRYKLQTWGSWAWITPAGVAACDPSAFVVFSPNWFDPKTGLAPNGLHITQLATLWQQAGGTAIPQSVIAAFPPVAVNPPPPAPVPPPPAPPIPGTISITLSADQVASVVGQAGAVTLSPEQINAIKTIQGIALPAAKTSACPCRKPNCSCPHAHDASRPCSCAPKQTSATELEIERLRRKAAELSETIKNLKKLLVDADKKVGQAAVNPSTLNRANDGLRLFPTPKK